jgi:DNA-directed RNA polymerase specialized sigma24 family protein
MNLLKANPRESLAPEVIFTERYDWLLKWALHFAQGDQAEAEDLVQDTFVRFVVSESETELKDPERIEPLLYTYLKFVHLSHVRRAQRYPLQELPLVDFDSIHLAMRETPSVNPIEVQDTLRRIVAYLTWRKEKAKSASILLLRFFHGYRKGEIMRVGLLSERVVANGLMLAREETRRHLAGDDRPILAAGQTRPAVLFPKGVAVAHDQFLAELRQTILDARVGPCLSKEELLSRYQGIDPKPIECKLLAHIVSCERCLDLVSKLHGIPPLTERSPEEIMDANRRTKLGMRGKGAGEGGARRVLRVGQQRLSELYDHQPSQLLVVVNGRVIASRDVSSAVNKLEVEIGHETKIEFIEIISEQGVCLLAMPVGSVPPEAPPEMRRSARLTNRRSVEIVLRFTGVGPFVDISYCDASLPLLPGSAAEELEDPENNYDSKTEQPWQASQEPPRGGLGLLEWLGLSRPFPFSLMNSLFTSALVLAFASVFCFFCWWRISITLTANAFLDRAQAMDASGQTSTQPGVIFQKIRIKTPTRTTERTLYQDVQRRRRVREHALDASDARLKAKLADAGVDWNDPLSAISYRDWHNRAAIQSDTVKRAGDHRLILTTRVRDEDVLLETLTVRESDFHAVGRTIELRDYGTVEIAELNYDVLPWGAVNQDWFEPLPGTTVSDVPSAHAVTRLPHVLTERELDEAELSARIALNELHADTGEQIQLTRTPTRIDIKGVVDTDVRKQELVSRLAFLANVRASILSIEEVGSRPASGATFGNVQSIQAYSVEAQPSPLERYLREKKLPLDQLATIFHSLLDQSLRVQHAEVHLRELRQRFREANQLPADQQNQLAALSRNYIDTIQTGLDANKRTLLSIGLGDTPQVPSSSESGLPGGDIDRQVRRYQELCQKLITSEGADATSAVAITDELGYLDLQIRTEATRIDASLSTAAN